MSPPNEIKEKEKKKQNNDKYELSENTQFSASKDCTNYLRNYVSNVKLDEQVKI